jgi:hypothetical protein
MPSLVVLRLSYCSHVGDKGMEWVLANCPSLQELYLSGCPRLTDQTCLRLASSACGAGGLRVLDLVGCYRINVQGLVEVLKRVTSLTTLYAPPCLGLWDAFTDARLWDSPALAFPHVEALHLSGMMVKEDTVTETIPKRLFNLTLLDLSGSSLVRTDPFLTPAAAAVAAHLPDLVHDDELDWGEDDDSAGEKAKGGSDEEGEAEGEEGASEDEYEAEWRERRRMEDAWSSMLSTMHRLRDFNLRACSGVPRDLLADLQVAFPHTRLSF